MVFQHHFILHFNKVLGLDFFTRYRFRVSAKNRCGWSQAGMHSDVFCTAAVAPPGLPTYANELYQSSYL